MRTTFLNFLKHLLMLLILVNVPISSLSQSNLLFGRVITGGPFRPTWESLAANYHCPEWFRDAKFGIWAAYGPQCQAEDGDWYARENILRALLDVASATQLGVTRANYSALVTKALSTLNFEKIKLSAANHRNYLDYADNAIHFYAKANDKWSDYFKYDWMREEKIALMMQFSFDELKRAGVNVSSTDYPRESTAPTAFRVPFDDCLSLYWKAADKFIDKMKAETAQ